MCRGQRSRSFDTNMVSLTHFFGHFLNIFGCFKVSMWCYCISQMVDSYILEFNKATLRIVGQGTNDYFDLNVTTYKKVWNNFEFELSLNDPYGKKTPYEKH